MIIVSQDKSYVVNFTNVETIGIDQSNGQYYLNCTYSDGNSRLAIYKTEERAQEVLQEIVSKYRQYNLDNNKAVTMLPKIYEMPKE